MEQTKYLLVFFYFLFSYYYNNKTRIEDDYYFQTHTHSRENEIEKNNKEFNQVRKN